MEDSQAKGALHGVRIVDLTTVVMGPYATQVLADYGADVIKVEAPGGDSARFTGPALEAGRSSLFLGVNRNKRSVLLDLSHKAGRTALLALVEQADVFIHNVRPQKLARLGLGPDAMLARNPRLIYAGLHGFGEGGAYAHQPAYDDIIQALAGAADLIERQYRRPGYLPTVVADKIGGLMAVHAVLAALYQREKTGCGQVIEVPMFEGMVSFLLAEHFYLRHFSEHEEAPRTGPSELGYPRTLATWRRPFATLDGLACVMPYSDDNWKHFFEAAGRPELAVDPRFVDIGTRTRNIAELYELMAGILATRPTEHWQKLCRAREIPFARVNRLEDLEQDPHLRDVGFFTTVNDEQGRPYRFTRQPVRLSRSSVAPAMPPRLGEHTAEVLGDLNLPPDVAAELLAPPHAVAR